ncbi:MAG: TonB-dependent receptor [Ignavibacteriae bacterium]|nr:TonB-dependent receptor [Ignavibacteriota bacterium]
MHIRIFFGELALIILVLFFISINLFAGTTGKITGVVVDKTTGEPLPSVNIMIEGTSQGTASDLSGHFTILNVSPGTHTIVFKTIGYADYRVEGVVVNVDKTTKVDAQLSISTIEISEVVVKAEKPPIEKDRTYSSAVVNSDAIQALPVTEMSQVITLQPGVVKNGDQLHFRGGRSREVAYVVDGVSVTNAFNQDGGSNVSVENSMIEQLEVITGTFNAEYGSAQSGVVNIVTKGISSKLTGNINAFTGDWISDKSNVFLGVNNINPMSERDIQGNISIPIIQDKLGISVVGRYNYYESINWYEKRFNSIDGWKIAAYERWFKEQRADEADASQAIYIPDSLKTGDGTMGPLSTSDRFSGNIKINYYPFERVKIAYQAFGDFSERNGYSETIGGSGISNEDLRRYQPDGTSKKQSYSHSHFLTLRHTPTDNFYYNISGSYQYNRDDEWYDKSNKIAFYPGDSGIQPIGYSSDGFSIGNTDGFYDNANGKNYRKQYLINGDLNWQIDKYNFIKAGFEYKQHQVNTYSWGFISTPDWNTKKWINFDPDPTLTFNDYWNIMVDYWKNWEDIYDTVRYRKYYENEYTLWRDYTITPSEAAAYLQDKVELGEIIINAGLRLDLFIPDEKVPKNYRVESSQLASEINLKDASTKVNLSPRFGVSFPISATGAFHAAYGHFYQMPSFEKMFSEPIYVLTPLQLNDMKLGNSDLEPERTIQYELGLQQQIFTGITADVSVYYKNMDNLLGLEYLTTIDNVRFRRFINRDYGNSKGLTIGVNAFGRDFINGSLNYTYSTANGSASDPEYVALVQSSTQIGGETVEFLDRQVIPLDWDQTHTLNALVDFKFTNSLFISVIGTYWTGQPYSPEFVEKYDILVREYDNADTKPVQWSVDLKARYDFNVEWSTITAFIQIDNLFDHLNQNSVYVTTGNAYNNARLPNVEETLVERLDQAGLFTLDEIDNKPQWFSSPRKIRLGFTLNF